jgi:DNA-binding CsgD family transcriptional regulator/predicted ATPase
MRDDVVRALRSSTAPAGTDAPAAEDPPRPRSAGAAEPRRPRPPLVGRADELERLCGLLAPGGPLVVDVTGARGAGKTAVIDAAVERVGDLFGDVQRLDLTGEPADGVLDAVRAYATRMPIPLHRGDADGSRGRSLLVLERADVLAPLASQLVDLAAADGSIVVLVESVPRLRATGCETVLVEALPPADAVALFRRTAESVGVRPGDDVPTEARIERICAAVDGNPLAVELAAARLPFLPLTDLDAVLASPHRALSVLSSPATSGTDPRGIRSALAASHGGSSLEAQQLLDLLSVFSGSFTLEAVEAVAGEDVAPCFDALAELLDLRLVELDPSGDGGRYRLSRLVRGFAAERLGDGPPARSARARHAAHYRDLARRAARADEEMDEDAARSILGEDYAEALEAVRWTAGTDPAAALRLAADLGWEAHRRGTGDTLAQLLEQLLAVAPAEERAARRDALLWLVRLGSWSPAAGDRVDLIRARLTEALALARELEHLPLLRALRTQFLAVAATGDVAAATAACTEGLRVASALGHARWIGRFELSLGSAYFMLRRYDEMAPLAASALSRALRSGDRRAVALAALALHCLPPGSAVDTETLPSLESVLAITREVGDHQTGTHVLATLAQRDVERGDHRAAASWVLARQEHLGRAELLHGLTVSVMLGVHVARLRGDLRTGARLHGSVASQMEPLLTVLDPAHVALYRDAVDTLRDGLGPEEFTAEAARGRLLDRDGALLELTEYLHGVVGTPPRPRPAPSTSTPTGPAVPALTRREDDVLRLLVQGRRNKEIAAELCVSPKTVMHHTAAIYRKLGVRSRTEAAATAARLGLAPLG